MKSARVAVALALTAAVLALLVRGGSESVSRPLPPAALPAPAPSAPSPPDAAPPVPGTGLLVRWVKPDGSPAAGVEAVAGPAAAKSGPDGVAEWTGLPAGEIRVRLLSGHRFRFEPLRSLDYDVLRPSLPERGKESPTIALRAGETARAEWTVEATSRLVGSVALDAGRGERALVKLLVRKKPGSDLEAFAQTDAAGGYVFEDAWPGPKRVAATWRHGADVETGGVDVELHPGQETRAPPIEAHRAQDVEVLVRVENPEALPADARNRKLTAELSAYPAGHPKEFRIAVPVPVGERVRVRGLEGSRLIVSASILDRVPGVEWERGPMKMLLDPFEGPVELEVAAFPTARLKVSVRWPAGLSAVPLRIQAGSEGGGTPRLVEGDAVELPAGAWRVGATSSRPDDNVFGSAQVEVAPGVDAEAVLVMGPGAVLRGRVRGADGGPLWTNLCWRVGEAHQGPFLKEGMSDEAGNFVLRGLPPSETLQIWRSDGEVRTGPAGSETVVELLFPLN